MWTVGEELAFRDDLIDKVIAHANAADGMLSRNELGNFSYAVKNIRVIDLCGGI